MSKKYKKQK